MLAVATPLEAFSLAVTELFSVATVKVSEVIAITSVFVVFLKLLSIVFDFIVIESPTIKGCPTDV